VGGQKKREGGLSAVGCFAAAEKGITKSVVGPYHTKPSGRKGVTDREKKKKQIEGRGTGFTLLVEGGGKRNLDTK